MSQLRRARWCLNQRRQLLLATWESEDTAVAYDSGSGDLHLISEVAAATLSQLEPGGLDERALFLSVFSDTEPTEVQLQTFAFKVLLPLEHLGLIKKISV